MQNPFTNTYGIKPNQYIQSESLDSIIENFSYDDPTEKAFMITGVRGSGKTVLLADLAERLKQSSKWEVININPSGDMLFSLASKLYDIGYISTYFIDEKIDISVLGIGVSIKKSKESLFNIEVIIEKMLEVIKNHQKKVLITVDEATPSKEMEAFCLEYQALIRQRMPAYMIMTGLYENIYALNNMEKCTFLTRTPRIQLGPLDISSIAAKYKKVFDITKEQAIYMAGLTKGYAFAFQTLGRLYFDNQEETIDDIMFDYESELIRYSYRKIWSELSEKDIEVVKAMVRLDGDLPINRETLMKELGFSSSMMNRYRERLRDKGIITTNRNDYGKYWFTLPMFSNFVKDYYMD